MAYQEDRPYLIVWDSGQGKRIRFQAGFFTSSEVGRFFKNHTTPKRPDIDIKKDGGKPVDIDDPDLKWLPGDIIPMKMYKQEFHHDYDSIHEIFNSDSLAAQRFREGAHLNDLLWEIEW